MIETSISGEEKLINSSPQRPVPWMPTIEVEDLINDVIRPTGDSHKENIRKDYHEQKSPKKHAWGEGSLCKSLNKENLHPRTGRRMPDAHEGIIYSNPWSLQFEGKSVLEVLSIKKKCNFEHLNLIINSEGGYIDDKGIIRRGKAKSVRCEITRDDSVYLEL